ncbi:MAG: aminoglycoside phosphotransferase family protein [Bacteroidales bacterium]|nr:aminoglycoside phosphotransferase family protein [Bacteroidales bacterium]
MYTLRNIVLKFKVEGEITEVKPLGEGLINDTFKVYVKNDDSPKYVLQRINNAIFQDVEMLQDNIEKVTNHIRKKLTEKNVDDIERKVLRFLRTNDDKKYHFDGEKYWRMMVFIPESYTYQSVTPEYSYTAGLSFGEFQSMLSDIDQELGETIPSFHNIELRLNQLREAVKNDAVGRVKEVQYYIGEIEKRADAMCLGEQLHREGILPKRICHCDTKVNNMLFDKEGNVLCVIDLDTVMPSFIFSDYGDFLRSAANTGAEDDKNLDNIDFNMEIFEAFTKGYLEGTKSFLLPIEKENLPYAAKLFPYMQTVRFLADYINGDTYYKIQYPEHNLVRTKAQWKLFESAEKKEGDMRTMVMNYFS